jgi:hypothetical protein
VSTKPKKIVIAGHEIAIVWDHTFEGDEYGESDFDAMTIRIAAKANTKKERAVTLFHECIHMALMITGHSQYLGEDKEEAIVVALERALGSHMGMLAVVGGQALPLPEKKPKKTKE